MVTGTELMANVSLNNYGHAQVRVRYAKWANPQAYARFDIVNADTPLAKRAVGPWMRLYDRLTQEVIGAPTPQVTLLSGDLVRRFLEGEWEIYHGPLDPADH